MPNKPDQVWMPTVYTEADKDYDYTDADKAIAIANMAFGSLPTPFQMDEWQEWLIREILSRDPDTGKYRFRSYVISMGRQNGKSTIAVCLSLWFMLSRGDANVFCLASNRDQAGIVYQRLLQAVINNEHLNKRINRTTETRGLGTKTGGLFRAMPSKGAALQGHSLSGVIADELHLMPESVWDSVLIGAGQQKDSIVVGITTAGSSDSTLLLRLYENGKQGATGMGFALWEADEHDDPYSIEALRKANPALACGRMDEDQVLSEVAMLPKSDVIRYRANRFVDQDHAWLGMDAWLQAGRAEVTTKEVVLCIDRSPDWSGATMTASWMDGEDVFTDVVFSLANTNFERLLGATKSALEQINHTSIVMDGYSLGDLAVVLERSAYKVKKLTKKDAINSQAMVKKAILDKRLFHTHNTLVTSQMRRASVKEVSDGEYRIVRTSDEVQLDAVMATVLGCYVAMVEAQEGVQLF